MMKSFKFSYALILLLLVTVGFVHAHALYIDTNAQGKPGKSHEVKVYYSEFKDRKLEKVSDWYSDVADFELWLVQPDGQRVQLETTPNEDHYSASFVPEKKGTYRLEIGHTAEDPGENTAYQFNAFAQVQVGRPLQMLPITADAPDLILVATGQGSTKENVKTFRTYFKGQPKGGIAARLFLPSGETKTLESDSKGELQVSLEGKGVYFLEATTYHEGESGKTKKAPFKSIWRCATRKIEI